MLVISNKLIQNKFVHFVGLFLSSLLKMHCPKNRNEYRVLYTKACVNL